MRLERLELRDFRNYVEAEVRFAPGLTAVVGPNGQGKTNLLEALGWLATLRSFRGANAEVLVREGAERAILRAEGHDDGRLIQIEAEIPPAGRPRVQVNRQRLRRARDLLGALRVTVFTPDDLALIKGGPRERRRYLDEGMVALDPRRDDDLDALDRVMRQRNALLRQCRGRLDESAAFTLDVWDARLAEAGARVVLARQALVARLEPIVADRYRQLAEAPSVTVGLEYSPSWCSSDPPASGADSGERLREALAAALATARPVDVARGVTSTGPHRDELVVRLDGLGARSHGSQGEQRSLALALRLATHDLVTGELGSPPLLLLDDVFSELDPKRRRALVGLLPAAQAVLTTTDALPDGALAERRYRVEAGRLTGGDRDDGTSGEP